MPTSRPWSLPAIVASTAVAVALVQPVTTAAAQDMSDDCSAVTIVAARGSSQERYTPPEDWSDPAEWKTDGWEGETLHKLFRYTHFYSEDVYGESIFDREHVDFLEIDGDYPAQAVTTFSNVENNIDAEHPTRDGLFNGFKNIIGTVENSVNYGLDFAAAVAGDSQVKTLAVIRAGVRVLLDKTKLSADAGTRAAVDQIEKYEKDRGDDCTPKYLLMGYSQGAMALSPLTRVLDKRNQLAGVVSLGNPYLKPEALRDIGGMRIGDSTGKGIYGGFLYKNAITSPVTYWTEKYDLDKAYISPDTTEYCVTDDMMCDHSLESLVGGIATNGGPHNKYYQEHDGKYSQKDELNPATLSERNRVAERIITAISEHLPGKFGEPDPGTGGDDGETGSVSYRAAQETMFVIDTTGSMSDDINATVQQVNTIADKLLASNPDSRIGLVEYRGPGEFYDGTQNAAYTRLPLSSDIEAFRTELQSMADTGGGREYVHTGILTALQQDWTPGVARSIIVIGDEPGDDHHLAEEVQRQLLELNKDKLLNLEVDLDGANTQTRTRAVPAAGTQAPLGEASVHVITNDSRTSEALTGLAEANNGKVFTYRDADIAESLLAALDEIADKPIAGLIVPDMSMVGQPQRLSAQLSKVYAEGAVEMTLDLGDGRVITLDETESADVVYEQPGLYEVTLTVTDSRGRQDRDVRYVAVETEEAYEAVLDELSVEMLTVVDALPRDESVDPEPTDPSEPGRGSTGSSGLSSR